MSKLTTLKIKLARKLIAMISTNDDELAVSLSKANTQLWMAEQWINRAR